MKEGPVLEPAVDAKAEGTAMQHPALEPAVIADGHFSWPNVVLPKHQLGAPPLPTIISYLFRGKLDRHLEQGTKAQYIYEIMFYACGMCLHSFVFHISFLHIHKMVSRPESRLFLIDGWYL